MKNLIGILFLFCFTHSFFAQTITYEINDTICCTNTAGEKFIDIDQDGIEEIRIAGTILTDIGYYFVEALSDNIKVTSIADKNESFENFDSDGQIAIGGVGCFWQIGFIPGDPNKFIGIQEIQGSDTIWNYIEIEFSEEDPNDNSCWDSRVIVIQSVVNQTLNQELVAGEILTNILELVSDKGFQIYPNPTSDFIYLQSEYRSCRFSIFNLDGKEIRKGKIESDKLDISDLAKGLYFIGIEIEENVFYQKFLKL